MTIKNFISFFNRKGIKYKFRWGSEGAFSNFSIFGIGRYVDIEYKGHTILFSEIYSNYHDFCGIRIKFLFKKPLKLGLYCTYNSNLLSPKLYNEYKPFLSKRIKKEIVKEVSFYTQKEELTENILSDEILIEKIKMLKDMVETEKKENGFTINDKAIIIIIDKFYTINLEAFIEMIYQLALHLEDAVESKVF